MRLLVAGFAVAVALAQGTARADESQAFDVLIDHGVDLYDHGDFKGAVKAFAAAYDKRADPEALFYLAKAHQRLGHFEEALLYYDRFLEDAPSNDYDRAEARQYRAMIARHLESREVHVPVFVPEPAREPEVAPAIVVAPQRRQHRSDPREWRQTMWWVSAATIVASYGVAVYGGAQKSGNWDEVIDVTKYTWWAGVGGAVYFYYTGFIRDAPAPKESVRVNPAVAVDGLGLSLELDF